MTSSHNPCRKSESLENEYLAEAFSFPEPGSSDMESALLLIAIAYCTRRCSRAPLTPSDSLDTADYKDAHAVLDGRLPYRAVRTSG